jgi:ferrochelatase
MAKKLQTALGLNYTVRLGMRYSDPTIESAIKDFAAAGVDEIQVFPLFPQYAEATTGSSFKEFQRLMGKLKLSIPYKMVPPFFDQKFFIDTSADIAKRTLAGKNPDHYLFSFHGLPESQVRQVEGCQVNETCCLSKNACAKNCYRAQCFATAKSIAEKLHLSPNQWSLSFQSRLGRAAWIGPSTDDKIKDLRQKNINSLAVLCPSFVADCIETLEEIGMGAREDFLHQGGTEFTLIPCLNDEGWEEAAKELFPAAH